MKTVLIYCVSQIIGNFCLACFYFHFVGIMLFAQKQKGRMGGKKIAVIKKPVHVAWCLHTLPSPLMAFCDISILQMRNAKHKKVKQFVKKLSDSFYHPQVHYYYHYYYHHIIISIINNIKPIWVGVVVPIGMGSSNEVSLYFPI